MAKAENDLNLGKEGAEEEAPKAKGGDGLMHSS